MRIFKAIGLCAAIIGSAYAQDQILAFNNRNPDVIFQTDFSQASKNYLVNNVRDVITELKGVDIFNQTLKFPELPPINELSINDMVGAEIAKLIKETLQFSLDEVKTTLDIYELSYKLGRPRFIVELEKTNDETMIMKIGFTFRSLEIDVDNIYVNNLSPGVEIKRDRSGSGKSQIIGKEHRTFIDDIYLNIHSPSDKPLIRLDSDTNKGLPSIMEGSISLKISKQLDENGNSKLVINFDDYDVSLFQAKDAGEFAKHVKIFIGDETKIDGLSALEYGSHEIEFGQDISDILERKKGFLTQAVAQPMLDEINGDSFRNHLKEQIDGKEINSSLSRKLGLTGVGANIQTTIGVQQIGILQKQESDIEQLIFALTSDIEYKAENLFSKLWKSPEVYPFPLVSPKNYQKSLDNIYNKIATNETNLTISFGQDFLNKLIYNATKGVIPLPNDPNTKADDKIINGPKGAFLMFEKLDKTLLSSAQQSYEDKADQGKVVIDILVKPNFFESVLLGMTTMKTKLKFPLVIIPELSFRYVNDIPILDIKVADIDLSEESLRNGLHGIESNLDKGTLRKFVLKKIKKILSPMIGSTLKSIEIKMFKGLDFSLVTSLKSDGLGRLNASLKLDPRSAKGKIFAEQLPKGIKSLIKYRALKRKEAEKESVISQILTRFQGTIMVDHTVVY